MGLISRNVLKRRPQELGKIKIGGKGAERTSSGGNKFRIPVKYDHFLVTTRDRGSDGNFERDQRIHEHPAVGESPTELAGILMYDRPDENFHAEFCQYKGRAKVWTCDGETAIDLKTGATSTCALAQDKECKCKPYGRLHLQLWASGHVLGYHVFRTTSWESVNNIQTALEEIYERFGTLLHAPVKLVLYPAEDSYTENGKEQTSHSWKVGLVLAMSMEEAARRMVEAKRQLDVARSELRLIAGEVTRELDERDTEEMADIGDEWFPDEAVVATVETQQRLDVLKAELGVAEEPEPDIVDAEVVAAEDGLTFEQQEKVERVRDLMDRVGLDAEGATAVETAISKRKWATVDRAITRLVKRLPEVEQNDDNATDGDLFGPEPEEG